ncbi:zinc finger protein CONSTANS-LIKE 2-like [Ipomoea triloba]|uniref:zinc finger protein CONSTANS-LIKE 2-like n=1 Tax=Ipomoea triloba TaxID=35885 RepID=UPI00125DFC37|nr:zinc finger protein CONSTANS-LIKE 2-like [Ipomoea triloba]
MSKEESSCGDLDFGGSTNTKTHNWASVCHTCHSVPCSINCRTNSAYLSASSQGCMHATNRETSVHEHMWLCDSCQRAPAVFWGNADAASLCADCDADIHAANPLARRHHRVPLLGTIYGPPDTDHGGGGPVMITHAGDATEDDGFMRDAEETTLDEEDEDEAASWLLLNLIPAKNNNSSQGGNNSNGMLYAGKVEDAYLDLVEYSSCQDNQYSDDYSINHQQQYSVPQKKMKYEGDCVVPGKGKNQLQYHQHGSFQFLGVEYENSNTGYPASISQSVSISSFDVGVVPESTITDASFAYPRPSKGTIDLLSGPPAQMPSQLTPMDREARVLRYREKKKSRKFEKTIRYASRKAYAETRPRIKGRFTKRTDVETEEDQIFSTALMAEGGYGIVPYF